MKNYLPRMTQKTMVLYLGRKGGGPRFVLKLLQQQEFECGLTILSENNELKSDFLELPIRQIFLDLPKSTLGILFDFSTKMKMTKRILALAKENRIQEILFSQPHIWDTFIAKRLKNSLPGVKIVRIVHDVKRHPGELWPNSLTLRGIVKSSDFIIFLSQSSEDQFLQSKRCLKYPRNRIKRLTFNESIEENSAEMVPGRVLFIGRLKKYKGLKLLLHAWELIDLPNATLVIAGDGKIPTIKKGAQIIVMNRWLTNADIENLISEANVVVLPYLQASQSGIIEIAKSARKIIVVTPVAGLMEQIEDYDRAHVTKDFNPSNLAKTLILALRD